MSEEQNQYEHERRVKRDKLREIGVDPYGHHTTGLQPLADIRNLFKPEMGHEGGPIVKAAGRIVLKRDMGKLSFITLRDATGDLQVGLNKQKLSELGWQVRDLLDLGDQIVVEGPLGQTNKGEISIWATSVAMAAKALLPPPAKWEGLSDVETRYRQRYVDLWANPEVMQMAQKRIAIVQEIRDFLRGRGFVEVETPMLQALHGGANARPFTTKMNALDLQLYMRIAPELYL
ncbi:MAG TPA: OB-fold nucleic acid binding domain-containing protein, partial [Tepidisphaeraceae bacterium]|nr:OB-fold nucleic acid binding domain-containing protein [Tepidisphaeraceae bacterium]